MFSPVGMKDNFHILFILWNFDMWDSSLNSETLTSKGHIVINVSNCLDLLLFDPLWMDLGVRIYMSLIFLSSQETNGGIFA